MTQNILVSGVVDPLKELEREAHFLIKQIPTFKNKGVILNNMRHGKKTRDIKNSMTVWEMLEQTAPVIVEPVDDDGDLLRVDVYGEFVYNLDTREVCTPYISSGNTYNVKILRFGEWKSYAIHRLVALAFCPRNPERDVVHHINADRSDNSAYNLLWVTRKEHATLHRFLKRGEIYVYNRMVNRIYRENKKYEDTCTEG